MQTLSVNYDNLIQIRNQTSNSIDKVFQDIKLYGINSIDISYDLLLNDFNLIPQIKRNNIKISSITSSDDLSCYENVSKQLEIVDFLVKYGVKSLIFYVNSIKDIKILTKNLRRITNYAKTYDIQVSIKNGNISFIDTLFILKNVKFLCLTYDIALGVINNYNHLEIIKWISNIYLSDFVKSGETITQVKLFSESSGVKNCLKDILNEISVKNFTLNYNIVENIFNLIQESAIEFKMEF